MNLSPVLANSDGSAQVRALANRVIEAYQSLGSLDLKLIEPLYASDIYFEDPAHGIQGKTQLMAYFEKMFTNVDSCSFKFHQCSIDGNDVFLSWTMFLRHKRLNGGETVRVEGASFLKTRNGQVYYHRDYFDLGAMLYEHLPLIGWLIKKLRIRLGQ